MRKLFLFIGLLTMLSYAQTGEEIFIKKCSLCHQKELNNMEMKGVKAPPMNMVSMRVKHMTASKDKFIAFVKDYIVSPSQKKGFCMPMAYKRFGTMPPIGKALTPHERESVAQWIYDNFSGSWEKSMGGKSCKRKNAKMKCGSSMNAKGKCGMGKCGSK